MAQGRMIAVVGPADASAELCAIAREVGLLLARREATVVSGGLGGVMAAASAGAHDGGGLVVGLLPGRDRDAANDDVDVAIATGLGEARNALVVRAADGVVAVGSSWGTLSEIAFARRTGKPVVCLRAWTITDADGQDVPLTVATSAEDAVAVLFDELDQPAR